MASMWAAPGPGVEDRARRARFHSQHELEQAFVGRPDCPTTLAHPVQSTWCRERHQTKNIQQYKTPDRNNKVATQQTLEPRKPPRSEPQNRYQ